MNISKASSGQYRLDSPSKITAQQRAALCPVPSRDHISCCYTRTGEASVAPAQDHTSMAGQVTGQSWLGSSWLRTCHCWHISRQALHWGPCNFRHL